MTKVTLKMTKSDTQNGDRRPPAYKVPKYSEKKIAVVPPCEMVALGGAFQAVDGWMPTRLPRGAFL